MTLNLNGFNDADDKQFFWILFSALCLTVPTFGFFVVGAGLVPIWIYLLYMVVDPIFGLIFGGLHLLVYGSILYGIAKALTGATFRFAGRPIARCGVLAAFILGLITLAFTPVYWPMSHSSRTTWTNIFGVLRHGL